MLKLRLIFSVMLLTAITTGCTGTNSAITVATLIKHSQNQESENVGDTGDAEVSADDIRSGYFKIDGVTCKLPVNCQEFLNQGWEFETYGYGTPMLAPGEVEHAYLKKGAESLSVEIANLGDEVKPVNSLPIIYMHIPFYSVYGEHKSDLLTIELPKGFILLSEGQLADRQAILDTFGEPDYSEDRPPGRETPYSFRYVNSTDNSSIYFASYNNRDISYIIIKNEAELIEKKRQMNEAAIAAYQVPAELGTDITSGIIEFEGDLYHLPAPVSAFQKNGWEINEQLSAELEPGKSKSIYLHRGDKEFSVWINNLGTETATLSNCGNCVVSSMDSGQGSLIIAGIGVGDSRKALEDLLAGVDDYYNDANMFYTVPSPSTFSPVRVTFTTVYADLDNNRLDYDKVYEIKIEDLGELHYDVSPTVYD